MMKLILSILLLGAVSVFSQTSNASLKGTVYDANGAVIVGATVSASDENGKIISTRTNNRGDYEMVLPVKVYDQSHNYRIAKYQISVTADGFEKTIVSDFKVVSGNMSLDIALDVMIFHDHDMIFPSPMVEKPEPQLPRRSLSKLLFKL